MEGSTYFPTRPIYCRGCASRPHQCPPSKALSQHVGRSGSIGLGAHPAPTVSIPLRMTSLQWGTEFRLTIMGVHTCDQSFVFCRSADVELRVWAIRFLLSGHQSNPWSINLACLSQMSKRRLSLLGASPTQTDDQRILDGGWQGLEDFSWLGWWR